MDRSLNHLSNNRQFTYDWWTAVCKDEERLVKWLLKLQQTEFEGYTGNIEADEKWSNGNKVASNIFRVTGDDERRHSDMLVKLLRDRGVVGSDKVSPPSFYWTEMDKIITDLASCAAVFHLGESLAAWRFEIISEHPDTPEDVALFINSALPDEAYHARSFGRLSTPEAIVKATETHLRVVAQMTGK